MENEKIFEPSIQVNMLNDEANSIVYNLLNCTSIQTRADKTFLVNLYKLKIFYSERALKKDDVFTPLKTKYIFSKYTFRPLEINGKLENLTFYDLCYRVFNLAKKTVDNYLTITSKFIKDIENIPVDRNDIPVNGNAKVEYKYPLFESYGLSKITELTTLMDWQIENLIKADIINKSSTQQDLRVICKRCKELGNNYQEYKKEDFLPKDEDDEEKLKTKEPEFDINAEDYDLFTFKNYSKSSLSIIAFDLYNEVRSLRKKLKKMRGGALWLDLMS